MPIRVSDLVGSQLMIGQRLLYYTLQNMRCYTQPCCLKGIYGVVYKEMAFQMASGQDGVVGRHPVPPHTTKRRTTTI